MTDSAIRSTVQKILSIAKRTPDRRGLSLNKAGGSYSQFAIAMRFMLPLVAIGIVVLVVAWPQLTEKPNKFSLSVSKVTATKSGTQQIINARFTGTDSKQRPYSVTADTASQSKKSPDVVELAFPKADITMQDGAWLALSAETGKFDRRSQVLNLRGQVNLFHDRGYQLQTSTADIFIKQGTASGNESVTGQGPVGTLEASGFRILDGGSRVLFTGKSRLTLYRTEKGPKG